MTPENITNSFWLQIGQKGALFLEMLQYNNQNGPYSKRFSLLKSCLVGSIFDYSTGTLIERYKWIPMSAEFNAQACTQ